MFAKCELPVSATILLFGCFFFSFGFFSLLNCCVSSFLSRMNPSSLPKETLGRKPSANSLHLRKGESCLQAFGTRWLRAVSKLISASVSDDELIISELARFAVPPPLTCVLNDFSLRVYVWLDAHDCRNLLGIHVEDFFSDCALKTYLWQGEICWATIFQPGVWLVI